MDLDRVVGTLVGLAVGDALGTTNEFSSRETLKPVTDLVGGGPFRLRPGEWTDDTSMAVCLAESLCDCRSFDPNDQMQRYLRWWLRGENSVTGYCFDIGGTTAAALDRFQTTGNPFVGDTNPRTAGNGSLMRLAPVVLFYNYDEEQAIHYAGESSRTTHAAPQAVDACRYFARLLIRALQGCPKEEILSVTCPGAHTEIAAIGTGHYRLKSLAQIQSSGYVVHSLEAALWCFDRTDNFRDGCLKAANLGGDTDTIAAIYGQLAGAYYGESGIPEEWRIKLAWYQRLRTLAQQLVVQP